MQKDIKDQIANEFRMICEKTNTVDSISITVIAASTGVSRQTIYYYFQDKYDIACYVLKRDIEALINQYIKVNEKPDPKRMRGFFNEITKIIPVLRDILNSSYRAEMEETILMMLKKHMRSFCKESSNSSVVEEQDFLSEYMAYSLFGWIIDMCSRREAMNNDTFSERISLLMAAREEQLRKLI